MESFKDFQDFVGVEHERLIKHCSTRWLSLRRCVARVISQYAALKSYFGAQPDVDRQRSKVNNIYSQLNDPLLLPWLSFIHVYLEPYYKFNIKFQVLSSLFREYYIIVIARLYIIYITFIYYLIQHEYEIVTVKVLQCLIWIYVLG